MALNTRPPTGQVAFPLVLVEGEEKAGKSYAALQLSKSPRVGRTFVLDLMDGTADEYAELGNYELLIHDGTHRSMVEQIKAACAVPSDPAKPNVVIVDSATAWWNMLVEWADMRARRGRANKAALAQDPDAEINISMNIWNDAAGRWGEVALALKKFPGIGVITAQGKEVSALDASGAPIPNKKVWKVEAHKSLPALVNAWVRMEKPHKATLIGVRSLRVEVPDKGLPLGTDGDVLERVVFDILGAGQSFVTDQSVAPSPSDFAWGALGWADRAEHDAARQALKDACGAMDADGRAAMKAWLTGQGWTLPYTRPQMDAWRTQVEAGAGSPAGEPHGTSDAPPAVAPVHARPEHAGTAEVLPRSSGGERQAPPPVQPPPDVQIEPGGVDAAQSADEATPPPSAPSGPVTLGDLLNRMEGKAAATRKGRLLKVATEVAREHSWKAPETIDDIDQRLLDAIADGLPIDDPRANQRRWMHAVWGLNGGNEKRKDAISRLTSGATDSSGDLTDEQWREFMDVTGALPVQLPPREQEVA